jgi:hypothetical protein
MRNTVLAAKQAGDGFGGDDAPTTTTVRERSPCGFLIVNFTVPVAIRRQAWVPPSYLQVSRPGGLESRFPGPVPASSSRPPTVIHNVGQRRPSQVLMVYCTAPRHVGGLVDECVVLGVEVVGAAVLGVALIGAGVLGAGALGETVLCGCGSALADAEPHAATAVVEASAIAAAEMR